MQIRYSDLDIHFQFEGVCFDALSMVLERFERVIPMHSHGEGCYELHYISEGYGKLTAEGRVYEITPNTLFVTGPHVEHEQTPARENPMEEYCVYLRQRSNQSGSVEESALLLAFLGTSFWLGQDRQGMKRLMTELFDELKTRPVGYRKQAELLLSQIIICMIRNYESSGKTEWSGQTRSQDEGRSLLIEEYFLYEYQHPSLKELADRLNLSERQTQRLLQKFYGKSFIQKKVDARMNAAAVLLKNTDQSITQIAGALGYSSLEHFTAEFGKYYGMSLRRYRKGR